MASAKRITRKDIRQPDWFQRTSDLLLNVIEEHRVKAIAAAVALIVILLVIWGWQVFKARQDDQAADEFTLAMSLYQEQKYPEAIAAFTKVEAYRWSRYSALAHLYETNSYMALNDLDKAIPAGQRFIAATKPESLFRQIGLVTLADAEERKGLCKQAVERYAEAANIQAALKDRALLGKARCAAQNGDNKTALDAYKEYAKNQPGAPAPAQIAELEAKVGAAPAEKK